MLLLGGGWVWVRRLGTSLGCVVVVVVVAEAAATAVARKLFPYEWVSGTRDVDGYGGTKLSVSNKIITAVSPVDFGPV